MTARKTQAPKDQEAADKAQGSQEIDLAGQREALDELRTSLAGLEPADVGGAIDDARQRAERTGELEQSVYLIHPVKGHVVHVTITEAVLGDMLTWADATLEDIRAAGLTA